MEIIWIFVAIGVIYGVSRFFRRQRQDSNTGASAGKHTGGDVGWMPFHHTTSTNRSSDNSSSDSYGGYDGGGDCGCGGCD